MFLDALFRSARESRRFKLSDLVDDDVWEDIFGESWSTDSGEKVNVKAALSIAPVWAAIGIIAGGCAKIPLKLYKRRQPGPGKDQDFSHQASRFIGIDDMANDETPAFELWRRCYVSALLFSNGYIWIDRDRNGRIHGLYNLLPDRTFTMRHKGRLWYVTEVNGKLKPLLHEDIIHVSDICHDGETAPELLKIARQDFGLQLAARKFTSKFFKNGAHLGGVLQLPPGYKTETRRKIEQALQEQRSGTDKAFKAFVMKEGYRWFNTSVEPQKAQTIELNDEKRRDVANWFRMNPSRLGVKDAVSYNSLEHDKQDLYDTTLSNWMVPTQVQCNCKLLTTREREKRTHVIRYQTTALLWADAEKRNDIAVAGIQAGRFSPDETRQWEDLNPRDDGEGDKYLRPLNMTVAGVTEPSGTGDDQNQRADLVETHTQLFRSTARRIGKRLETHAARAAKKERLDEWLLAFEAEHRGAVTEMLTDVVPAMNAAGVWSHNRSSQWAADYMLAAVRNDLDGTTVVGAYADDFATWAVDYFLKGPSDDDDS